MTPLPPLEWIRAHLPSKLNGAPGDTFIAILSIEESLQRAAFELGVLWVLEGEAAVAVERRLRLVTDNDADEILQEPHDTEPPSGAE